MFSILHISDLHRSQEEPVDNSSLIAALLADCDRYMGETPIIPLPGAIIVSGDLIQGARIGQPDWAQDMRNQYLVAEEFLDQLVKRFLNGDRSKLIVIPGNHDVCWNTSIASMELVSEEEYPADVRWALIKPDSTYRWSWKERALYKINSTATYQQRMGFYWDFVENFYAGTSLLNPIDRNRGYQLFELCDRQIVVAAFDSISGNDCFSYSGAIPRGAIAKCNLALRDINHSYNLRVAVWHHSISGPPLREDYMEISQVNEMVGLRFQLGLHGHQHVAAATTQYVHLNETQNMAVVSAGSLCAGSKELPRGVNRQYNLIVIEDDFRRARVHVRELVEGDQFARKSNSAFPQGYVELNWQASLDLMGREIDAKAENDRRAISLAEKELHNGNYKLAIISLSKVDLVPDSYARRIAVQALLGLRDWELVIEMIDKPQSSEEEVLLLSALINTGALDKASTTLIECSKIDDGLITEFKNKINLKNILKSI